MKFKELEAFVIPKTIPNISNQIKRYDVSLDPGNTLESETEFSSITSSSSSSSKLSSSFRTSSEDMVNIL